MPDGPTDRDNQSVVFVRSEIAKTEAPPINPAR
jgi:hypothetical protein